ncbi:MAG: polysaccharide deacetylase family protein, partial [Bacteroidales bacterium]|nr:polysaccharide deacetylase family protein [Bacteroidales bacterium]
DQHGRIVHEQSFVVRHQLHKQATVQRIALHYKNILSTQQPGFKWKEKTYRFLPTFDIDIAYAFKGKTFFHFCGALGKAILSLQWGRAKQIIKAQFQQDFQDPYDVYDIEKQLCEQHQLQPLYFFLISRRTQYDRNISPHSPHFSALVQRLKTYASIGLHPSYHSKNQEDIIKEKKTLEEKGQVKIQSSRQHFLKVKFPDTFRNLIAAGITDDYSLGFYDRIGFRNGMAIPFPFFDVKDNKTTKLMLHPLLMMDSAAVQELGMEEKYQKEISKLIQEGKTVGGEMTALWHSNFMPHGSKQLGLFKETFEQMC